MRIRLCTLAANSWGRLWRDAFRKCNLYYSALALTGFVSRVFGSDGGVCEGWATRVCLTVQLPLKRMRKMRSHIWRAQIAGEWWAGFGPMFTFQRLAFGQWTHPNPAAAQEELPGRPVQPSNKSEVIHTGNQHGFNWASGRFLGRFHILNYFKMWNKTELMTFFFYFTPHFLSSLHRK